MTSDIPTSTVPVAQVRGLGTIIVRVSDLDQSLRFYREMLGFVDGEQLLSPGVTLVAGDATIYLVGGHERGSEPGPRGTGVVPMLMINGLRQASEALQGVGVEFIEPFEAHSEHFSSCTVADPDGNPIELVGRP